MTADNTLMIFPPYVVNNGDSIDLILDRETPAFTWPDRQPVLYETFTFPLRCKAQVLALAEELRGLSKGQAARVRDRRREIMWP
jgi:hypothetical protein